MQSVKVQWMCAHHLRLMILYSFKDAVCKCTVDVCPSRNTYIKEPCGNAIACAQLFKCIGFIFLWRREYTQVNYQLYAD